MKKWIIYQRERFPLLIYIPMSFVLGAGALCYSRHLPVSLKTVQNPGIFQYVVSVLSTLMFFMLLIIGDEHRDYEKYVSYYPHRPLQRGLITLRELRRVGTFLIILQMAMNIFLDPSLLGLLSIVYIWFILMSIKFFIPELLKKQPTLYLMVHMLIIPMMVLHATAIEWLPRLGNFSFGISMFILSAYCNGMIIEIGKKLVYKEGHTAENDTYARIWGTKRAMIIWMSSLVVSYISSVLAAYPVKALSELLPVLSVMLCFAVFYTLRFLKNPSDKTARVFRRFPWLWNGSIYLILSIVPFFKKI